MRYRFCTLDVFTDTAFGGNQLAVLPDARGLGPAQMQQVAREFNFSESTFVLPARAGHTRQVRIFTPTMEVPFAGHPNVGTAFALAALGEIPTGTTSVEFEEQAGVVPVAIRWNGDTPVSCELREPQPLSVGARLSAQRMAGLVTLDESDIVLDTHAPCVASVGLPFVVAELRDRAALSRARANVAAMDALLADGIAPDVHVYVRSDDGFDIRTRMFAPHDGVPEDPATGSANCALVALLATADPASDATYAWRIAQGVEMGRPSVLSARVQKRAGEVTEVYIGGACVMISRGEIEVPGA